MPRWEREPADHPRNGSDHQAPREPQNTQQNQTLSAFRRRPRNAIWLLATIARIRWKTPGFIGVSVRTRRLRPRVHPRGTAARSRCHRRAGGHAGREDHARTERPPLRHQLPSRTSPARLKRSSSAMRSPQGDRHGPTASARDGLMRLRGGQFYREIDGPAGRPIRTHHGLSHSSSSATAALSRRQGVLRAGVAVRGRDPRRASSWPRRRDRRGSCDGGSRPPATSPATTPGATCPTRTAFTLGRGRPPASTSKPPGR